MRGEVFDTDAVVGGSQGCWIECLTGMLNSFFTGMLEYLVKNVALVVSQGCRMQYFTLMLDPFLTGMPDVSENNGSSFGQGCSMSCLTMMLDWMFDRDNGISVRRDAGLSV